MAFGTRTDLLTVVAMQCVVGLTVLMPSILSCGAACALRTASAKAAPLAISVDEVTTPVLVHFDLWDGNILVESGSAGHRIGALIDAERAFWGDPLAEFVSLALFTDIEQDTAFLHGYRAAGGTVTFDLAARQRLALYRAYLYLIMWVETAPRGFGQELLDLFR